MNNANALIIIPTYNELDNIERMLNTLFELYPHIHLLIVDDGSPDGTANVVKRFQQERPEQLHLIERSGKLGLGTAYIAGFKWALARHYEYILEMDCDFSHDPKDVGPMIEAAQAADLVIGSRYIGGIRIMNWPFHRLLLSCLASLYVRLITGIPIMDVTGGFKCFRRKTLETIDLDRIISNGYSFQIELNYKAWCLGFKLHEHPIVFHERRNGQSKMNRAVVIEAIHSVITLRLKRLFGGADSFRVDRG